MNAEAGLVPEAGGALYGSPMSGSATEFGRRWTLSTMSVTPADFYDAFGDREFIRPSLTNIVSELLHRTELHRARGRVLDVGAGVGRFSVPLARLCSSMVVVDVSAGQLERNRALLANRGLLSKVECHLERDVSELTGLSDDAFDTVVCFRGPLNYCTGSYQAATRELFRVLRPGGLLLLSVRSVHSGVRPFVQAAFQTQDPHSLSAALALFDAPLLEHATSPPMRLFSVREMISLVTAYGGVVDRMTGDGMLAPWLDRSAPRHLWRRLVRIERRLAPDPYSIAHANHVIMTVRKTASLGDGIGRPSA
jgi:ubiquinone/menaquinone biosynthesis C-methylase UbiE